MLTRILMVVASLSLLSFCSVASAEEKDLVGRVNDSIRKGKAYLIQRQSKDGNWEGILESLVNQEGGRTALATLALLNCGVSPDDRSISRAMDYLRSLPPQRTYVVALSTMVFAEGRQPKDLDRIKRNADWLITNAIYNGGTIIGWSYPAAQLPDASNTQYAMLGLYAAKTAGVKIDDKHWLAIRDLYANSITEDGPNAGFWRYNYRSNIGGMNGPSFTMTVAGVCGLQISNMAINQSLQAFDPKTGIAAKCGIYATNDPIAKGMNWISSRFAFDSVPGLKSVYYNVYGVERLGRLSGQRFIGKYDWYREGCEYLIRNQQDDGSWTRNDRFADQMGTVASSFALLFLSKGRTPVLITKFAHGDSFTRGGEFTERGEDEGIVGWNRKQNDCRNLTEFASRELFNRLPLAWQVYDPRRIELGPKVLKDEVESLLASPILYMNGHKLTSLTGQQKELLKRYIEEGGFVFAEACCGSPEFTKQFTALLSELFPESRLEPMRPEHPIWRSFFQVSPADLPGMMTMERGCKTVIVLSTKPLAGYWEENRFMAEKGKPATTQGERAYQLAGNVIAYATGMQPPEQRGSKVKIIDAKAEATPPRGAFKPAQLRLRDEIAPAPAAMRNLMGYVRDLTGLEAALDKQLLTVNDAELLKFKFLYLHGRKKFQFNEQELENLRLNLETGGLLFADSACGKKEFDEGFRAMVKELYPERKLELVPLDDELYSKAINGIELRSVKRREKADGSGSDGGFADRPPHLEGIKIDGRWVILYSKYDVGCALERHKSTDCLGHTPESALQLGTAAVLYSLKR